MIDPFSRAYPTSRWATIQPSASLGTLSGKGEGDGLGALAVRARGRARQDKVGNHGGLFVKAQHDHFNVIHTSKGTHFCILGTVVPLRGEYPEASLLRRPDGHRFWKEYVSSRTSQTKIYWWSSLGVLGDKRHKTQVAHGYLQQ